MKNFYSFCSFTTNIFPDLESQSVKQTQLKVIYAPWPMRSFAHRVYDPDEPVYKKISYLCNGRNCYDNN